MKIVYFVQQRIQNLQFRVMTPWERCSTKSKFGVDAPLWIDLVLRHEHGPGICFP